MRGIGKGQTIQMFIVPEILQLIKNYSPQIFKGAVKDVPKKQMLNSAVAWLIVNSMRVESIQFNMLCEQNIYNVFRQNAFNVLMTNINEFLTKTTTPTTSGQALNVFLEGIDYSVENAVPQKIRFLSKLQVGLEFQI